MMWLVAPPDEVCFYCSPPSPAAIGWHCCEDHGWSFTVCLEHLPRVVELKVAQAADFLLMFESQPDSYMVNDCADQLEADLSQISAAVTALRPGRGSSVDFGPQSSWQHRCLVRGGVVGVARPKACSFCGARP